MREPVHALAADRIRNRAHVPELIHHAASANQVRPERISVPMEKVLRRTKNRWVKQAVPFASTVTSPMPGYAPVEKRIPSSNPAWLLSTVKSSFKWATKSMQGTPFKWEARPYDRKQSDTFY